MTTPKAPKPTTDILFYCVNVAIVTISWTVRPYLREIKKEKAQLEARKRELEAKKLG